MHLQPVRSIGLAGGAAAPSRASIRAGSLSSTAASLSSINWSISSRSSRSAQVVAMGHLRGERRRPTIYRAIAPGRALIIALTAPR